MWDGLFLLGMLDESWFHVHLVTHDAFEATFGTLSSAIVVSLESFQLFKDIIGSFKLIYETELLLVICQMDISEIGGADEKLKKLCMVNSEASLCSGLS